MQFDLGLLGFDAEELARIMHGEVSDGLCDPDDVPEAPTNPITRQGDLWLLGDHRLLCGDSTSAVDVQKLMAGETAKMMFTDPPWNVAIGLDSNPRHRQRKGLKNDTLSPEKFQQFLNDFIEAVESHVSGDVYCVLGASEWPTLDATLRSRGFHWSATIIWAKDIFVLGRSKYHRRYEPIWYGWREKGKSSFIGRRDVDDVWEIPRPKRSEEHPTMKPVQLPLRAIINSSVAGDIVVDPFGGSGSTLIACEQTQRRAHLMEIDPIYCSVIIRRWERFTGRKAERIDMTENTPAIAGVNSEGGK
jgi:DNA modification methylase